MGFTADTFCGRIEKTRIILIKARIKTTTGRKGLIAMFRDAKEELARLEAELLATERAEENDALLEAFLREEDGEEDPLEDYLEDDVDFEDMDFGDHPGMVYQNYSNNYGRNPQPRAAYNSDRTDEDLNVYSDEVYQGQKDNIRGLLITALVLLGGIFAVLLFWVFRYLV